jgi:hypothetical protein
VSRRSIEDWEVVTVHLTIRRRTAKAVFVEDDEGNEAWLPRALINDESPLSPNDPIGTTGDAFVPRWVAVDKELHHV